MCVVQFANFSGRERLADADMDRTAPRQSRRSRPGVVGAVQTDWQQRRFSAPSQGTKTWVQREDRTVGGPRSFRENQNDLTTPETTQRLSESRQAKTVTIDRDRVKEVNQPPERREPKERLSR
jgi:hypothetical protein